jgi:endoglucanase
MNKHLTRSSHQEFERPTRRAERGHSCPPPLDRLAWRRTRVSALRGANCGLNPIGLFSALCLFLTQNCSPAAEPATPPNPIISRCNQPFMFGFGSWDKATTNFLVKPDGIHISAKNGQGGTGMAGLNVPLAGYDDWSPELTLTLGEKNKATTLNFQLSDADGTTHSYQFDLRPLTPGVSRKVVPNYGASLAEPQKVEKPGSTPGLESVATILVMGDWTGNAVEVVLTAIELTPPTDALGAGRAKLKELQAKEAERVRQEAEAREKNRRKLLEAGAPHPADGPVVRQVCAVARDVIALTLQAGKHVSNQLVPYQAEAGDEIVEEAKDNPRHEAKDGRVVEYFQKALYRKIDNRRTRVGLLAPDGKHLFIEGRSAGQVLEESVVDVPAAYRVQSADDPAYATPTAPAAVFRKGKPNGFSQPLPFLYTISLKLAAPLKEGATYTIQLVGVNASKETVTYVHQPRITPSLAVHAIQTGYRPDDPYKRAYLSFWTGVDQNGKSASCTPAAESFELLDAAGKTVFTGKAELAKAEGAEEQISIHEKLDYTKAAVYRLDFSRFRTPGEYRVLVPGLGVSGSFRIAADVWEKPFQAAMQGVLHQRQGIALEAPFSRYTRPRPFHPDDGVEFYQMTIPVQGGQEAGEGGQPGRGGNLLELAKAGQLQRVAGVWGGYQDAGDWDTMGHHLSATYDLLGLYDLSPTAFARIKLSLPPEEAKNNLPDILDEAMWQMPCWKRLQVSDGGVRGGYGYGWGCPPATTSSMIKSAGVYAVDPATTMRYAATAARAARVLGAFDKKQAAEYLESAKRAWTWAESHSKPDDAIYQKTLAFEKNLAKEVRDLRAAAAVELLAVTRDSAFDAAFRESSELRGNPALYLEQPGADFAYARLPDGVGEPELKKEAVKRITAYADHALAFSHKNAYDIITGHRTDMPMIFVSRFFSTPGAGGLALIYAYELTKKPEYLAAAVQGANYSLGANPDNLSYCTGVGENAQHFSFIVDAQITGQLPDVMVGHIPYGQGNEGSSMSRGANGWVQTWLLNFGPTKKMIPNWFDWPVTEQYIDFARYPLHNENCFNQTTIPAACYWFWLAARE